MKENRYKIMPFIFESEGAYALREDLGQSNKGIELHTFFNYRKRHGMQLPVYKDLENITEKEASDIYNELFFDRCGFDQLASGVDYAVADCCITLGVHGAADLLQQAFKIENTGKFDQQTIDYLNGKDPKEIVQQIRDAWIAMKKNQPLWGKRGKGWTNRNNKVLDRALAMVAGV
jgi:lysozyme family protein